MRGRRVETRMYNCGQCGKTTRPGERANMKVIETRDVTYPTGHTGTEIVREIKVCDSCVSKQLWKNVPSFTVNPKIFPIKAGH